LVNKRRILYLLNSRNYSGAKRHFASFMEYADFDLIDFTVISLKDNFPEHVRTSLRGIKFQEYNFAELTTWFKWVKFLWGEKPHQIIFAETWINNFNWLAIFAAWLVAKGNVYMQEYTDVPTNVNGYQKLFRLIPNMGLNNSLTIRTLFCKKILVCSNAMKEKLIRYYYYPPQKIDIAHSPLDSEKFSPRQGNRFEMRSRYGILSTDVVCIVTSRLEKMKAVDMVIEAFTTLINDSKRKDIWLWILGDGPLRAELNCLVEKNGIGQRVIFLGFQNDVEKYLQESDIFILASEYEGFSVALLEALSVGLVCVATPTGGSIEAMQDKGFIVEHTAESIFNCLLGIIHMNKGEIEEMKRKARKYILDEFDKAMEAKKNLKALAIPAI
jgi:glycosyltransferase involved in cell wall biosynthesis